MLTQIDIRIKCARDITGCCTYQAWGKAGEEWTEIELGQATRKRAARALRLLTLRAAGALQRAAALL